MKAAIIQELGPIEDVGLSIVDIETPTPGPGEVLLKVGACGVCRSNLHMAEGDWAPNVPSILPIVPGHEVAGTVVDLGPNVTELQVGDRVGVQPIRSACGSCGYCASGREQLCPDKVVTGEMVDGGFAEYMIASAKYALPIPEGIGDAEAAPLFCPGITAYGAVEKAGLRPGQKVAVFGVGGVGHVALQLAMLYQADVFGVSRSTTHHELIAELGAVAIDSSVDDPVAEFQQLGGLDAALVFAPSTEVVRQAIESTKPGGRIVIGAHADIGPVPFYQEKTVVGSVLGTRAQMAEVLKLAAAGKIKSVVEVFELDQASHALVQLKRGGIHARAVIVPKG